MNQNLLPEGTPILSMDDPDFASKLRDALGLKEGEQVEVVTPQFTREPGAPPAHSCPDPFDQLFTRSLADLKTLGLRAWDEPDENGEMLMLLPGEWYDQIPNGTVLRCIDDTDETFIRGVTDDDIRFGCLAFGIKVKS
jgi:hypothetical protein